MKQPPPFHDLLEVDDFFRRGDEGAYEGAPSERPVVFDDLEEKPDPVRTGQRRARRDRYTRFVVTLVTGLGLSAVVVFARDQLSETASTDASTRPAADPISKVQAAPVALPGFAPEPPLPTPRAASEAGALASGVAVHGVLASSPVPDAAGFESRAQPAEAIRAAPTGAPASSPAEQLECRPPTVRFEQ